MSKKLFGKFFIFLLVVGLLFAVAPTGQAQAATLDVCPTCTYTTIQAAIDVAVDGDTISVGPGTYVGAIVINKPNLTIRSTAGADTTIIDANGAVMAVQLENNLGTVTFNGFSVTNFTDIGIAQSMFKPNTVFHVLNNKVVATGDFLRNGINVSGSGSTIIGNTVIGATYDNPSYGSSGIIVVNASNVLIQNNNISGTPEYGITINNWSNTTPMTGIVVSGNTITGADYGVLIWANDTFSIDGVTLTGNTITDYSAPVAVFGTVSNVTTLPPVANITSGDYFYTIQEAINAATPGDTITVNGTHVLTSVVNVNKAVTLTCATGAKIQVSGTGDRFDVSAAATIQNCEIEKTDEVGQQDIIRLRASGISIKNNKIWGLWDKADSYVSRAIVINAGGFSDILITGNEIYGLRQPAYISGTHTGTISNNYVHDTKGWVLEGGNLTFTGNTWANNIGDIAILGPNGTYPGVPAEFYTDIVAMSAANNGAVIEDQRMSPPLLSVVYVDDSAAAGGNGTQATPYQTIQDGIARVIPGGTVNVAAGTYNENLVINKSLNLIGAGRDVTIVKAVKGRNYNGGGFQSPIVSITGDAALLNLYPINITAPTEIAGPMKGSLAAFGPLPGETGWAISGEVVYASDPVGCTVPTNVNEKIALIDRGGGCTFTVKADNAQKAGAIGVIIANNTEETTLPTMGSTPGYNITIPVTMITKANADSLKAQTTSVTAEFQADPYGPGGVTISGFTFHGNVPTTVPSNWSSGGIDGLSTQGIETDSSVYPWPARQNIHITNNKFVYAGSSVVLYNTIGFEVSNNVMERASYEYAGFGFKPHGGNIAHVSGGLNGTIEDNVGFNPEGTISVNASKVNVLENIIAAPAQPLSGDLDIAQYGIFVMSAAHVNIEGNSISGLKAGPKSGNGWPGEGIWVYSNASDVTIIDNTLSNNVIGVHVEDVPAVGGPVLRGNKFINNVYSILNQKGNIGTAVNTVDAKENYWNSEVGPNVYSVTEMGATSWAAFYDLVNGTNPPFPEFAVSDKVDFAPWCKTEDCLTLMPDEEGVIDLTPPEDGEPLDPEEIQTAINNAPEGSTIVIPEGEYAQVVAFTVSKPNLTIVLSDGTVIQNSSPCFTVDADNVTITSETIGGGKCVPTGGSDGIVVNAGVSGVRIVGLEIDGKDQETGDGIHFAGAINNFQIVDNYIHDLDGSAIEFVGTPSGTTMHIQGNLFQNLGAAAIVVPTGLEPDLNAEFNSWGVYAGATLTDVDTEPHTHADFYMEYEGIIPLEKVAVGNTITYTVYGNLQNISGADFTLKFPTAYLDATTLTNKSAFTAVPNGPDMFIVDETAGTIRFRGDASTNPISGENLPIFEVVFTGTAAGTGAISFDQTNDVFAMSPGYGPSTWVYAAGYVDRTVEVFVDSAAPTLESWTPAEGDIYLAEGEDFVLTVDALDDNLFSLEIDHNVTGLPEFTVYALASNVYGSPEAAAQFAAAGVTVTYDETTQTWVLTFDSAGSALEALLAKKNVEIYAVLHDQAGKTWGSMYDVTPDNTFAYTIVFDNTAPELESWAPAKNTTYMLPPSGDFVVTVDAKDINLYELEIDHNLASILPEFSVYADEADPYGGDGTLFAAAGVEVTYDAETQTWVLTFENGGPALNAIIANQGITFYAVIHDLAGNKWGSMYDVTADNTFAYTLYQQQPIARADSTGGDVVAVVSADGNTIDFTGEVAWYPADPLLGRTSGHRIGVRLSAPERDFDTTDASFTFNGQTYDWTTVKDGDDYVLVYPKVTAETQSWEIVVTWGGGFSQTFTVNFTGTLGPVTAYTVDGEISMQGRFTRDTEDVIKLTGYGTDIFTADSLDKLGINYTLANVLTGEYTITTHQPRYLNITTDLAKKITLISNRTLPPLELRAGNVKDTPEDANVINLNDASMIGTVYGATGDNAADANFDLRVNIQDLALVGGNFGLTSADAYDGWTP